MYSGGVLKAQFPSIGYSCVNLINIAARECHRGAVLEKPVYDMMDVLRKNHYKGLPINCIFRH